MARTCACAETAATSDSNSVFPEKEGLYLWTVMQQNPRVLHPVRLQRHIKTSCLSRKRDLPSSTVCKILLKTQQAVLFKNSVVLCCVVLSVHGGMINLTLLNFQCNNTTGPSGCKICCYNYRCAMHLIYFNQIMGGWMNLKSFCAFFLFVICQSCCSFQTFISCRNSND